MNFNAFILDWTMDDYDGLKAELDAAGFEFEREAENEHIRVKVPFDGLEIFADICRPHLNAPCNYIDVQFPKMKRTVLIFSEQVFMVGDVVENEAVVAWALGRGLPLEQADWPLSFD